MENLIFKIGQMGEVGENIQLFQARKLEIFIKGDEMCDRSDTYLSWDTKIYDKEKW